MQKHISLTLTFLLVLILLFFYPKPNNLMEMDYLIQSQSSLSLEVNKGKNSTINEYSIFDKKENMDKIENELNQLRHPMP